MSDMHAERGMFSTGTCCGPSETLFSYHLRVVVYLLAR
jgi:hypothetical protein